MKDQVKGLKLEEPLYLDQRAKWLLERKFTILKHDQSRSFMKQRPYPLVVVYL